MLSICGSSERSLEFFRARDHAVSANHPALPLCLALAMTTTTTTTSDTSTTTPGAASTAATGMTKPSTVETTSSLSSSSSSSSSFSSSSRNAAKQLLCGGVAGATAKTVTAPFSRLTILYQVHSLVTTKEHRPRFSMSLRGGFSKIVERGGILSLWRGNGTSVLHRFPYSAINFFVYENTLRLFQQQQLEQQQQEQEREREKQQHWKAHGNNYNDDDDDDDDIIHDDKPMTKAQLVRRVSMGGMRTKASKNNNNNNNNNKSNNNNNKGFTRTNALSKFVAGAVAGSVACIACYPLDLVRTRLTTELEGREHYRGMVDAFRKIAQREGYAGYYSGLFPTLLVAVPNFAISYTVYGTLKEHVLDDELFYNIRPISQDTNQDEPPKLGFQLTLFCGSVSGALSTLITYPFDTIRRRMQIQNLHILEAEDRLTSRQQALSVLRKEGIQGLYRGLTPELLKVIPMVGTMFVVYEFTKDLLQVESASSSTNKKKR